MHKELKAIRIKNGYKQQYVADKIGITQGHLSDIERGRNGISIELLECFATFYGLRSVKETLSDLFE